MKKIITLFLFLIIGITIVSAQVIKGRVLDENGDPIASATVAIKELQKGVSTDESGKFRFTNLPKRELW